MLYSVAYNGIVVASPRPIPQRSPTLLPCQRRDANSFAYTWHGAVTPHMSSVTWWHNYTEEVFNSSAPNAAYMRQWSVSVPSLVHVMACHLFGAKPLSEPMLVYCQLNSREQISVKFKSEFYHFHSRKCIWNCRLLKWQPFCPGRDKLTDWDPNKLTGILRTGKIFKPIFLQDDFFLCEISHFVPGSGNDSAPDRHWTITHIHSSFFSSLFFLYLFLYCPISREKIFGFC